MSRHFTILMLCATALLSACTIHQKDVANIATESKPETETFVSFEPDTLYDLMVSELGWQRQNYDVALGNYLKQAHKTRDAGVAKRAYQIAAALGAHQAALDAALLWSKVAPDDITALSSSALELMKNGKYELAIEQMKQVLERDNQVDFEFMVSGIEFSDHDREKVIEIFEKLSKDYPSNRTLFLVQALLLHQSGRNNEALLICNRLIVDDSEDIRAFIIKSQVLNKMGREAESKKMLVKAVRKHPDNTRLSLLYAKELIHANKLDMAQKQLEVLLLKSPGDAEILLYLGLLAIDQDMLEEAKGYFHRLLALGRHLNVPNFYLGKISENQKKWKEAQKYYSAVTLGKEFMMAQLAMAQMLIKRDQWPEVRRHMATARGIYPTVAEPLFLLEGELEARHGSIDLAIALYGNALQHLPESADLFYARAILWERKGKISEMEADLINVLAMQPDNVMALNALGYTLADRTERFIEAKDLISKAYALNSDDPAIIDSMGWVHYKMGNLEKALTFLQVGYEKSFEAEMAAHLGEVLWKLGRKDEAISLWIKVLKENPDSKVIKETINRLEPDILVTSEGVSRRQASEAP
ncbi:MAG: tetratricopeptide repeat protein [Candidatus Endonucleobacter bathymodioli]|uniref:Tetratricopeptide repeat protein n=1 Tax=Candidatus Endonucleibacter bathymodioli TaxID=539814 RepID=A0AA90SME9_9GAMM|nr:tetratricopeptide repeat protein [Candidatus Endonucleobacter bathymodioli]